MAGNKYATRKYCGKRLIQIIQREHTLSRDARFCEDFPGSNYTPAEIEFMLAMDRYKRERNKPFPAWSEVLTVLIGLGYHKG